MYKEYVYVVPRERKWTSFISSAHVVRVKICLDYLDIYILPSRVWFVHKSHLHIHFGEKAY